MSNLKSDQNSKEKNREWLLPDSKRQSLAAGLYLVATPIGNMGDMSLRALDTLAAADAVLCEDTRVTGKLLHYFGLHKKLDVYNDHSDDGARAKIVKRLADGEALVLVSDAGMPMVSDPGYKLVVDAKEAGVNVTSIPGANAPLAALQLSGLPSYAFSFIGFLPSKTGARQSLLKRWIEVPSTLLAFETAPRLQAALADIQTVFGEREVAVVREITKLYEEVVRGTPEELVGHYEQKGAPKGEIVLVIGPPGEKVFSDADVDALLKKALEDLGTKKAAAAVAEQTGLPKSELYERALVLKG